MSKKKKKLRNYGHAMQVRSHNKSVTVARNDGNFIVEICSYDPEHIDQPSVQYIKVRGKLRVNALCITQETMDDIIQAYNKLVGGTAV